MKRVIAVLALVLVSCAQRTKNLDFHTSVKFSLDVAELVDVGDKIGGITSPKTAKNSLESENGDGDRSVTDKGVSEKTNPEGEKSSYSTAKKSDKETIYETVFYVFDQNGVFQSKSMFSGSDNFDVGFKQNGPHTVYVLCNISEFIDLPANPTKEEMESLAIPHRETYARLPFAGKTEVDILPGETPQIKIKLNRINSAIRLENRSTDRIDIEKMTVSGLPSMGYVFTPGEAVQGVTYNETAEAQTDADGNAVVYSFMVPKAQIADVKLEAKAKLKDAVDVNDPNTDNIATVAPLSFLGSLEAGKRATALIGYLENGTLRVGSPENWGNVGKYQLTDDVLLQVIGGTFNDKGELRAYSGGCEFSFIIVSKSGDGVLEAVTATDWIHINDNVIVVDPNTTDSERRCRIAVKVGGQGVGMFTIIQGNAITFTGEGDTTVEEDKVTVIGGKSTPSQVKFTISDAELAEIEIVPEDNGTNGVTVNVDRSAKTITATFMSIVDASEVDEEGVSVPVKFIDLNGGVQATVTFVQRPARITFPNSSLAMPYSGDTQLIAVTTEGEAVWAVKSVTDESGSAISWLTATASSTPAASGNNMTVTAQTNTATSSRTGYVRVESRYTISRPLVVEQEAAPDINIPIDMGDGIEWMRVNLANPRQADGGATFATKLPSQCTGVRAESHGKFYQYGVNVAWNTTGALDGGTPSGTWNTSSYPTNWNTSPCPDGYRLPTDVEFQSLINNTTGTTAGGWTSSDYGYITFTSKHDSFKKLEFPAVGNRGTDGTLYNAGSVGYYWASVIYDSNNAYELWFDGSGVNPHGNNSKRRGFSVRCVKGEFKPVVDEIEMGDLKWAKYNLANPKQASGGATFATKLPSQCSGVRQESHGKFYQWGVNVAWNTIGALGGGTPSGTWQTSSSYPSNWDTNPCPDGYRLPSNTEFQTLISNTNSTNGGGWSAIDYGYKTLTLTSDSSKKLELTAVGRRTTDGTLDYAGTSGSYWTSDNYDNTDANFMGFTDGAFVTGGIKNNKRHGQSVRCVKGEIVSDIDPDETVTMGDLEWMQVNLANPKQAPGGATFATKLPSQLSGVRAESHGKFYQWGVNVAWNSTGDAASGATPDGSWNSSTYPANWDTQPCPDGYRIPTLTDFGNMLSNSTYTNGGGWSATDYGYVIFTSKTDQSKKLEFPAVGSRNYTDGLFSNQNKGFYWMINEVSSERAYGLYFDSNINNIDERSLDKHNGFSVRCVKDYVAPENTVTMGDLEWMRVNLANPKQAAGGATFATKLPSQCSGTRAESHGKFYQWGINVAWNSTSGYASGATPDGSWNSSTYPANWDTQPCPDGYRLPTDTEYQDLINNCNRANGGRWTSSDYGYITLTLKTDTSKKLEFPAVGWRNSSGILSYNGTNSYYWTSVSLDSEAASNFGISNNKLEIYNTTTKRTGYSVRCVKGEVIPDIDPTQTVDMGGTEWMQVNLANPKQASGGATFATKLPSQLSGVRTESHGKFYQWGVNVAWNSTGALDGGTPSGSWNTSTYPADWNITHPCPEGYRLPTRAEFETLINSSTVSRGGGWISSDYGYIKFTSGSNSVEFPAVGYRVNSNGTLRDAGTYGYYWFSIAHDYYLALHLTFTSSNVNSQGAMNKLYGLSVRCVKESVPDIDPTKTVTMGGNEWMQVNLANPKQASGGATFATKLPSQCSGTRAESHGKFYQWGINVAWNTTGSSAAGATPSGSWSSSYPSNWNTHPCPDGYRLPTDTEFRNLINSSTVSRGGGWRSSDYGYIKFTSGSNSVEFPAVSFRDNSNGTLYHAGVYGRYWSSVASTSDSNNAYGLYFTSSDLYVSSSNDKRYGLSVRCVKDLVVLDEVEMGGLKWMTHNLANPKQASGGATFATKLPSECSGTRAESHGKFYQYGINVAWNSTGSSAAGATPSGSWNTSTYPSNWNTQPCPEGWRLPTNTEFQNLIDNCTLTRSGGWTSSDYGYITLTLKTDSSKKLEFPAVGYRGSSDGSLGSNVGAYGYYWSSVAGSSNYAYNLYFNSSYVTPQNTVNKQYGLSVRCVRQ